MKQYEVKFRESNLILNANALKKRTRFGKWTEAGYWPLLGLSHAVDYVQMGVHHSSSHANISFSGLLTTIANLATFS